MGRFVYSYDPEKDVADGSPIRNIASVYDVEILSRFLSRPDLLPVAERSLRHYADGLVERDGALILDESRVGEPSGSAHSAFMVLSLLESSLLIANRRSPRSRTGSFGSSGATVRTDLLR